MHQGHCDDVIVQEFVIGNDNDVTIVDNNDTCSQPRSQDPRDRKRRDAGKEVALTALPF